MSSATVAEKPLCRGRGIGVGWIGKYKPKPCRVTKEDIVNLPQSFNDAERDSVSRRPELHSQTSVENLSERIARDILGAQTEAPDIVGAQTDSREKKVVRTVIDLTGDDDEGDLDDSEDSSHSWIDSIDNTLHTDEKKNNTGVGSSTESVMKAYTDNIFHEPISSSHQFSSLCAHESDKKIDNLYTKGISMNENVSQCDLDEKPATNVLSDNIFKLNLSSDSNDSITDEVNRSINSVSSPEASHKDIFLKAVYAEEFIPSWYADSNVPEDERNIQNEEKYIVGDEKGIQYGEKCVEDEKSIPNGMKYTVEDEQNAIAGSHFFPSYERSFSEDDTVKEKKTIQPYAGPQPFAGIGEADIVLHVLDDVILTLMDDPGDFDNVIEQLTDHLANFVTKEETLKQVVDRIVGKAIDESNFSFMAAKLSHHFDECKALDLESGVKFRKIFFDRCVAEFTALQLLCKDAESCKENNEQITRTALLFGELLCTMKIKAGVVNPLYRKIIEAFIDMFLDIGSDETVTILTTLLKLVGPELDIDRPKDVEALFDKVKDFYLDTDKSANLAKSVRTNLWNVYKLHSRDWDRATSPLDSPSVLREPKFFAKPERSSSSHHRYDKQKSNEKSSCSSPIDWDEYYDGDDLDFYQNYMDRNFARDYEYTIDERGEYWFKRSAQSDEECEAFEEFLRMSGQA